MVRKPGRMYRRITGPAYTRKEFIAGIPQPRIHEFEHGDLSNKDRFGYVLHLVAEEDCQIRHTALEAARVAANKYLMGVLGGNNYYLKIRVYPHHVLREHKMATGAGADRISSGMSMAFGKPVGTAARVKAGETIIIVAVDQQNIDKAKEALKKAKMKLPTPARIDIFPKSGQEPVSG
ncbi:MAG: 50S ribosomal protein L16 [Thermoplasmata archaeon]